jgi:hypothetical protein
VIPDPISIDKKYPQQQSVYGGKSSRKTLASSLTEALFKLKSKTWPNSGVFALP